MAVVYNSVCGVRDGQDPRRIMINFEGTPVPDRHLACVQVLSSACRSMHIFLNPLASSMVRGQNKLLETHHFPLHNVQNTGGLYTDATT